MRPGLWHENGCSNTPTDVGGARYHYYLLPVHTEIRDTINAPEAPLSSTLSCGRGSLHTTSGPPKRKRVPPEPPSRSSWGGKLHRETEYLPSMSPSIQELKKLMELTSLKQVTPNISLFCCYDLAALFMFPLYMCTSIWRIHAEGELKQKALLWV